MPELRQPFLGGVEHRPDLLHADGGRVDLLEVAAGVGGDELGERGFPGAGRPVEDDAGQPVGLEHPAEQFARSEKMLLPGELVERARPHPHRQRRDRARGSSAETS